MIMPNQIVNAHFNKYDVYIGRPSKWGNPYSHLKIKGTIKVKTRKEAILKYIGYITKGSGKPLLKDLSELEGKILGCWCYPQRCHGEVLIKLLELKKQNEFRTNNQTNKDNKNNNSI